MRTCQPRVSEILNLSQNLDLDKNVCRSAEKKLLEDTNDLLLSAVEQSSSCNETFEADFAYEGKSFQTLDEVSSVRKCQSYCYDIFDRCSYWVYSIELKQCYLKTSYTKKLRIHNYVSGMKMEDCQEPNSTRYTECQ